MDSQQDAVEAPEKPAWVSKARSGLTYRGARRNAAKKRRAWQGGTIRERMDDAPYQPPWQKDNWVAIQPVYYEKYSKTSAKVYRGGNVPGRIRRFKQRLFVRTSALRAAYADYKAAIASGEVVVER